MRTCPGEASRVAMKAHFFKLLHAFLNVHKELRPIIGQTSVNADFSVWDDIVKKVEAIVEDIFAQPNIAELDVITEGELQSWGGKYKTIPYWRCQPYFRTVDGEKQNTRVLKVAASGVAEAKNEKKRPAEENTEPTKKIAVELVH